MNGELTHIKSGCKAAAGDPEVVGVFLSEQELNVRVPEFDVSVGAAAHEHLVAGRKAASHHAGLADRAASGNNRQQDLTEECSRFSRRQMFLSGQGGELFRPNLNGLKTTIASLKHLTAAVNGHDCARLYLRNVLEPKSHSATVPSQAPASRREESGASAHTRSGLRPGCSSLAVNSPVSELHTNTRPSVEQLSRWAPHALKQQQWTP